MAREQTEDNKDNAIDYSLIDCFSTMELGEMLWEYWEVKRPVSGFLSRRGDEESHKVNVVVHRRREEPHYKVGRHFGKKNCCFVGVSHISCPT